MKSLDNLAAEVKLALEKEPRVIAAYFLGSCLTGNTRSDSDFDLAVIVDNRKLISEKEVYELVRQIKFPKDLDFSLIDRNSSPLFMFQVVKNGKRVYQINASDAAKFEAFVLYNYYDTQYIRNIYNQSLTSKFTYAN